MVGSAQENRKHDGGHPFFLDLSTSPPRTAYLWHRDGWVYGTDGRVLDVRPAGWRIAPRARQDRRVGLPPVPSPERLAAVVRQLRVGDEAAANHRGRVAGFPGGAGSPLPVLRDAVRAGHAVWLSFVDSHGIATERFVMPLRVGGGMLEGRDRGSDEVRRFPLHRITRVEVADGEGDEG